MADFFHELTVGEFLDALADGTPSPGGGSAIALAGALAAALAGMVASLTVGRDRYKTVEPEMLKLRDEARELQLRFARLADEDAAAFMAVIAARRLPGHTEAEAQQRRTAIASAMRAAIQTPLATAEASVAVLRLAETAAVLGNRSATSDAAVAGLLARATLLGARENALANLRAVHDEAFAGEVRARLEALTAAGEATAARVAAAVSGE